MLFQKVQNTICQIPFMVSKKWEESISHYKCWFALLQGIHQSIDTLLLRESNNFPFLFIDFFTHSPNMYS